MRGDMDKVLVERPRVGGRGARKGRAPRDLETLPGFQGLRRQVKEQGDFKTLNENLAPLRRYLERQINRPWSKVYGEIRAGIDAANTVQAHVLTHVDQYIRRIVEKREPSQSAPCGLVFQGSGWSGRFLPMKAGDLYVDPQDGIIKRARRRIRQTPTLAETSPQRWLDCERLAMRLDGAWCAIDLAPYQLEPIDPDRPLGWNAIAIQVGDERTLEWIDPMFGSVWAHQAEKLYRISATYGPGKLATGKRPLNNSELRRYGLKNEAS